MHRSISKIGYSQSFAISNNCLDSCPKCGQNICEHTSVADVINLPNSISQDFSTYSSDSSLIKQMFGADSSTAAAQQFKNSNRHINFSRLSINTLNNYKNSKYNNGSNFYLNQNSKQSQQRVKLKNDGEVQTQKESRPHSCQVLSIDNETTDKLLREFFENTPPSSPEKSCESNVGTIKRNAAKGQTESNELALVSDPSSDTQIENFTKLTKLANQKVKNQKKKKTKFSNFRLFLKSNKSEIKSSSKCAMRSRGLVNCLTSSASSSASSCEDMRPHRRFLLGHRHKKDSMGSKKTSECHTSSTENEQIAEYKELQITKNKNSEQNIEDLTEIRIQVNSNKPSDVNNIKNNIQYSKSAFSINSKVSNYMCEVDDYNEPYNLELCPIVFSDADEDFTKTTGTTAMAKKPSAIKTGGNSQSTPKSDTNEKTDCSSKSCHCKKAGFSCNSNINSNNFNNNKIVNNHSNTTNVTNISSIISVPLNTYLFYNYERKENEDQKQQKQHRRPNGPTNDCSERTHGNVSASKARAMKKITSPSKYSMSNGSITNESVLVTNRIEGTIMEQAPTKTRLLTKKAPIEKMSNIIPYTDYACDVHPNTTKLTTTLPKTGNLSYYTSCSSLDQSLTLTASSGTTTTQSKSHTKARQLSKYHSITIIFILIGLFSINFIQEIFMMFYYFSTEQTTWFISSLIAIFCGQFITLVITLLADIDLMNLTPPVPSSSILSSVSSNFGTASQTTFKKPHRHREPTKKNSIYKNQESAKELIDHKCQDQSSSISESSTSHKDIYLIFQNPFSKLCLLMLPGYLPISVYIKFLRHVFMYRKSSGQDRFKYEFQLSLHLFFNAIFYSLPLVLTNACYLASTTTARSLNWYYAEFYSFFSVAASYFTPQSTVLFEDANLERRNQLVLLLVSIFISISIGVCLFTTYYELMKQINYLSVLTFRPSQIFTTSYNKSTKSVTTTENNNKLVNLGLVEILVYFCYKFCLITSRLAVIALFWYSFREWMLVAILCHIFILYAVSLCTVNINDLSTPDNKHHDIVLDNNHVTAGSIVNRHGFKVIVNSASELSQASNESVLTTKLSGQKRFSRFKQHLILFITCLLSYVDLFMNQLSEIFYIKKIICFYALYFVQNMVVLTYWLVTVVLSFRTKVAGGDEDILYESNDGSGYEVTKNVAALMNEYLTPVSCYAIVIYLSVVLFTIFGLVLKFLHLHILRRRYRRITDNNENLGSSSANNL